MVLPLQLHLPASISVRQSIILLFKTGLAVDLPPTRKVANPSLQKSPSKLFWPLPPTPPLPLPPLPLPPLPPTPPLPLPAPQLSHLPSLHPSPEVQRRSVVAKKDPSPKSRIVGRKNAEKAKLRKWLNLGLGPKTIPRLRRRYGCLDTHFLQETAL